ncbi:hypothetical protein SBC1_21090 [Caballeronia sp. SBC1]|nr:hypothetical protein SBC2_22470 [Caballeronia sp. SBC2]QIN62112.1 hypothetical protein SBC1_21090 [Caballeronia sp. SBC1]
MRVRVSKTISSMRYFWTMWMWMWMWMRFAGRASGAVAGNTTCLLASTRNWENPNARGS